jgi:glutamyl-tRNA synthetase
VVVDDIDMKITHVIRGDDHISNTPKQLIVYQLLGVEPPKFAHIPMVLGPDGSRLSKRHGARSILEYRDEGYLPQAVVNYLARLGWGYGDQEYFTVEELIEKFDLSRINLSPARFDPDKFLAINAYWIRTLQDEELLPHLKPFIANFLSNNIDTQYLLLAIRSLKPRVKTLKELAENMIYFLTEDYPFQEDAIKKHLTPSIKPHLEAFYELLDSLNLDDEKDSEEKLRKFAEERSLKLKDLAQAIRVALTGRTVSPPLFEVMKILGKERVKNRIKRAIERCVY